VFRNYPLVARLLPRLLYQLVPAALVTTVGVLLLSSLAKISDAPPAAAPVETAINAEAVFKIVPREAAEEPADAKPDAKRAAASRAPANPKPLAAGIATPPSRKAANEPAASRQVAGVAAPLPIVQPPEQPQPAAATPDSENTVMSKLRSATTAVQRIPQWATRSVAGWFSADAPPPRPPAPVPTQNFQAGT
jgi:hypothetical protein